MKFKTLSIFPEFFEAATNFSLLKKAEEKGLITIENYNLRDWSSSAKTSEDKAEGWSHKMVDDRPFGGGAGMVMMVGPVYRALRELKIDKPVNPLTREQINKKVVIFSPKGRKYDQIVAEEFAKLDELILICPHYEGFDERILNYIDEEICIGDYVLTGGEIPALAVIDSVSRLIPGVLGNEISSQTESFSELSTSGKRNLEYPQYTRPSIFIDDEGNKYNVPEILLSGNHKEIEKWREDNSTIR